MVVNSILLWASLVIGFFTYLWIVFHAFKDNVFWGIALLFAPLAAPAAAVTLDNPWFAYVPFGMLVIFVAFNLFETYKAFLITITSIALFAWSGHGLDMKNNKVSRTVYDTVMNVFSSEGVISVASSTDTKKLNAIESARQANALTLKRIEQMNRAGLISDEELAQARMDFERQLARLQQSPKQPDDEKSSIASTDAVGEKEQSTEATIPATEGSAAADQSLDLPKSDSKPDSVVSPEAKSPPEEIPVNEASKYLGTEMEVTETSGRIRVGTLESIDSGRLYFRQEKRTGALTFMVYDTHITQLKPTGVK